MRQRQSLRGAKPISVIDTQRVSLGGRSDSPALALILAGLRQDRAVLGLLGEGWRGRQAWFPCLTCKSGVSSERGWKERTGPSAWSLEMSWLPPSGPTSPAEGWLPDAAPAPALEVPAKQDCRPDTASNQVGAELAWIRKPACPTPHPTDGKTEAPGGSHCQIASQSMSGSCTPYPTTPASGGQRPKGHSGSPAPSTVQAPGVAEEAGGHQQHAGSDPAVEPPALCYTPLRAGSGPVPGSRTGTWPAFRGPQPQGPMGGSKGPLVQPGDQASTEEPPQPLWKGRPQRQTKAWSHSRQCHMDSAQG